MAAEIPVSRIEPLTGHNYQIWALKMAAILRSRNLYDDIISTPEPPKSEVPGSNEAQVRIEWEKKNNEAFGLVIVTLSSEQAGLFIGETNARKVWEELKRIHEGNIEDKKIDIGLELKNIKMADDETVDSYITRARNLASRSATLGQIIPTRELVYHVVRGLHHKLEKTAMVLRTQRHLTLEEVQQTLREEETRLTHSFSAMHLNARGNERAYRASRPTSSSNYFKHGSNTYDRNKSCYICGKRGHIAKWCWHRSDHSATAKNKNEHHAYSHKERRNAEQKNKKVVNAKQYEKTLSACESEAAQQEDVTDYWTLDSGCTSHMSPSLDLMANVRPFSTTIKLAEQGRVIEAQAKGDVRVSTEIEGEIINLCIKDVLYVPKLSGNLLSVKRLVEKGNKITFDKNGAVITSADDNSVLATPREVGELYVLETFPRKNTRVKAEEIPHVNCEKSSGDARLSICKKNDKYLWHRRLGHIHEKYLDDLRNKEMAIGLEYQEMKLRDCEECILGKLVQTSFKSISYDHIKRPLELLHIDLCGPMPVVSLGGAKYIFTIVDTYSRCIFVHFLATKDEAFDQFVEFMHRAENELNCTVKAVRSDNGGEFVNVRFMELFKERGIEHQKTVPYTPQSNGVAERANRTILDKTRTMLIDASLPLQYWAEAAATAAYLINRIPTKANRDQTPIEKWKGYKPNVSYLKVFGCLAYYYMPKDRRSKLDPRARKGIFLGYSKMRKAYRIYDVEMKKIVETRSVKFNEEKKGAELFETDERVIEGICPLTYDEIMTNTRVTQSEAIDENCESDERTEEENEKNYVQTEEIENETPEPERRVPSVDVVSTRQKGRKAGDTDEIIAARHKISISEREERLREQGVRRSERLKTRYEHLQAASEETSIPKTYYEAIESAEADQWLEAMEDEIHALEEHQVWDIVPRTKDMKVLKSKWIFNKKQIGNDKTPRWKARLVAAGHTQRPGIDYDESYSPVVKMETFRTLIALAAERNLLIKQFDVKTAYLYGKMEECVYMEKPTGFLDFDDSSTVCKLKKSIYGLPQSGYCWNQTLNEKLLQLGLQRLDTDPCVYRYVNGDQLLILAIYVDDILVLASDEDTVKSVVTRIGKEFELREITGEKVFLGVRIRNFENAITLDQEHYVNKILKKYGMQDAKPTKSPSDPNQNPETFENSPKIDQTVYSEMLGSLMYLSTATRPDITFTVNCLSQFSKDPREIHLNAVKRVYRYLINTKEHRLLYQVSDKDIYAYTDASWNSTADARSYSGCTVKLGSNLVIWKSRKQTLVTLSTCEAEIVSICEGVKEILWLRSFLNELGFNDYVQGPTRLSTDSKAAAQWIKRQGVSARTKHINRNYYFVKEKVKDGDIKIDLIGTDEMEADVLTKSLCEKKHKVCVNKFNIVKQDHSAVVWCAGGDVGIEGMPLAPHSNV